MVRRYQLRYEGREIEVNGSGFVVGRETDCQLVLDQSLVSRHHARLTETADGLVVEDLRSRNGVFVNQRRICEPTVLAHGDIIGVGLGSFEVMDAEVVPRAKRATLPHPPYTHGDSEGPDPITRTPRLDVLTEREREVFELIILGFTQKEIGQQLHISIKTVETHRARLVEKLRCRTRAELVAYAITAGVLQKA